jgi:hypothetical protein
MTLKRRCKTSKLLIGGDDTDADGKSVNWNLHKLSLYYATIIIGYFGCKIFMGFYKVYSNKNPNQEIQDFNTIIVLSLLTYIFTGMDGRHVLGDEHKTNILFYVGYIVGLNYPAIKNSIDGLNNDGDTSTYKGLTIFFYSLIVTLVITMIFFGAKSARDQHDLSPSGAVTFSTYLIFIIVIILLVWGLVYTRKKSHIYTKLDRKKVKKDQEDAFDKFKVKTAGTEPFIDPSVFSWLITLLFMYDAQEYLVNMALSLLNGVVFGIFVSSISMNGIKYILVPMDKVSCNTNDKEDCLNKGLEIDTVTEEDKSINLHNNIKNNIKTLKWLSGVIISILIVVIILFFYSRGVQFS